MKKTIVLIVVCLVGLSAIHAQKWDELTEEQKMMKLESFRADNQKYLKDSLQMTKTQLEDIDNLNICFLSTLDRIDRYAKNDGSKEKYADALWEVRWAQLDAIMGKEKHERFAQYIERKIDKATKKK